MAKDYARIAKDKIKRPGESGRMPRILVYGRNKKGKTHFVCTAPNVLVLDTEDGTIAETASKAKVWPIDSWEDIHEAFSYLRTGKHSYEWVGLDNITDMHSMALNWVMRQAQEKAIDKQPVQPGIQHFGRANAKIKDLLVMFHSLRTIGVIITAREKMVEVAELDDIEDDDDRTTPPSYQYVPDITPRARPALNGIVDLTGRIYVVRGDFTRKVRRDGEIVEIAQSRQRRLLIGTDELYETGYRSEHELPDIINNPTVPKLVRAMREGVKQ